MRELLLYHVCRKLWKTPNESYLAPLLLAFTRCNENTVSIIDVSNKTNPELLSRTSYQYAFYTHQGWLTEDHNAFIFGDEEDEAIMDMKTKTLVLNVEDLLQPVLTGSHSSQLGSVDHNQFVLGSYTYQTNNHAGFRLLRINEVSDRVDMVEIASFDVRPEDDGTGYYGAWSSYPFFPSGNVIVSSVERGLFVLNVLNPLIASEAVSDCANSPDCDVLFGLANGKAMEKCYLSNYFCTTHCIVESLVWVHQKMGFKCGTTQ